MKTAKTARAADATAGVLRVEFASFLQNILESSTEYSIIGKDLGGNILFWNKGARRLYGYEPAEVVAKANARILYTLEDVAAGKPQAMLQTALRTGKWEGTITRVRKDGGRFSAHVVITPRRDGNGRAIGYLLISHDITERIRAEESVTRSRDIAERKRTATELQVAKRQLHALVGRLHNAQEEEAKRIARALHDDLGQQLTVLNLELGHLEAKLSSAMTPQQRKQLARMHTIVANMIGVVQNISSELRLGQLDVLGLTAAVDWQLMEFSRRFAIPCRIIRLDEIANLSAASSAAIIRILQETLTNIVRHAGATKVEVSLQAGPDQVTLEVRDNGRGITPAELKGPQAIGLLGMRERAQLVSGEVTIASEAGMGTTVLVRVPVSRTGATPP